MRVPVKGCAKVSCGDDQEKIILSLDSLVWVGGTINVCYSHRETYITLPLGGGAVRWVRYLVTFVGETKVILFFLTSKSLRTQNRSSKKFGTKSRFLRG
jgi:hypothetical protein